MDVEEIKKLSMPDRKEIIALFFELEAKVFVGEKEYCNYNLKEGESKVLISNSTPFKYEFLQCFKNSDAFIFVNEEFLFFKSEIEFIGSTIFFSGKNKEKFVSLFKECGLICYPEKHLVNAEEKVETKEEW